ncbi:tyrosine-protein phosphatase [Photobacterium sanctipauli]|nr:tyrosine-protein phosphatase [Photobacterium sanctipauli]
MQYVIRGDFIEFTLPKSQGDFYLVGTFTNWQRDNEYKFTNNGDNQALIKELHQIDKIGNSGYIEYSIWNDTLQSNVSFKEQLLPGHYFNNQFNGEYNHLLFLTPPSDSTLAAISRASQHSYQIKSEASHFTDKAQLANFRVVTGGEMAVGSMYRSYHPVIASRSAHPQLAAIERLRQATVRDLIEQAGVRTVINLCDSGDDISRIASDFPPSYYQRCCQQGQVFSVPMAYETVYFMSDRNQPFNDDELGFEDGIRRVISVIAEVEGPYLVHCRLGSDRTGVVSAFLQLLMGSDKAAVEENYLKTNEMGIGEYRSFRLLARSLIACLGTECFEQPKQSVERYLARLGVDDGQLAQARANLAKSYQSESHQS